MPENGTPRPWFEDERTYIPADPQQVKMLALKYRLTQGQVRGLIARYGMDMAKLDAAADRLRRC